MKNFLKSVVVLLSLALVMSACASFSYYAPGNKWKAVEYNGKVLDPHKNYKVSYRWSASGYGVGRKLDFKLYEYDYTLIMDWNFEPDLEKDLIGFFLASVHEKLVRDAIAFRHKCYSNYLVYGHATFIAQVNVYRPDRNIFYKASFDVLAGYLVKVYTGKTYSFDTKSFTKPFTYGRKGRTGEEYIQDLIDNEYDFGARINRYKRLLYYGSEPDFYDKADDMSARARAKM